ncbi:hypothetical protein DXG03_009007 [Asterophora parasitica]|uniref:Enoyl reductase (ER) domain-containing protein n=1 Tax=Asterophora parasitica TaxID=117018 RepID=A0A9P7G6N0_9AGAR|nr:hypothetical protein DXG03_009007 [Asterophora parasitica]
MSQFVAALKPRVSVSADTDDQHLRTQKALFLESKFGEFKVRERNVPAVIAGHLLVRIESVALNPIDWKIQKFGIYVEEYPAILGVDTSGVVVEVGEGVSGFTAGDRVFFQTSWDHDKAGYQQYTLTDATLTAKIPSKFSFDETAAIPVALAAATAGLYLEAPNGAGLVTPFEESTRGKESGKPIVIYGAIQLAKLSGFSQIITTASLKNTEYLKSLGATHVLDRNLPAQELASEVSKITSAPINLIYDTVALPDTQKSAYSLLADGGALVLTLPPDAEIKPVEGKRIFQAIGIFVIPHARSLGEKLYSKLTALLEEGVLKPNHVEVLPNGLNGVVAGLERLQADQVSGAKLVAHPQETA